MRKGILCLTGSLILLTALNVSATKSLARNNYTNIHFSIPYCDDGTDGCAPPSHKEDGSAAYIKVRKDSMPGLYYWIAGGPRYVVSTSNQPATSEACHIAPGEYHYFSIPFYPKYTWVCPVWGAHQNISGYVRGWWSPDNIRGLK